MSSRFLPAGWDVAASPIVLLAGQGGVDSYPYVLAQAARRLGVPLRLLALKGETSDALRALFPTGDSQEVSVGDLGGMVRALKRFQARGLIMAGRVTPGRVFQDVFPDLRAIALWASLREKNAQTIFGAVTNEIEREGVQVLDARCFMDDQIATAGIMVHGRERVSQEAIDHATHIAQAMATHDVGQSVVTRKGTVLAVEAFEGTDAMIARCGQFKADEKIFVKTVKKHQDYRFDVPIFGLPTLQGLVQAQVGTVVLRADGVIIPGLPEVLKAAQQAGITIIGY